MKKSISNTSVSSIQHPLLQEGLGEASLGEASRLIKAEAHRLGFFACGIAKAEPVDDEERRKYLQRVESRSYANMDYMYRNVEKRLDPTLLVPGTKSIISVALNYTPSVKQKDDGYKLASYALGHDYHDIMKKRLRELASKFGWKELKASPIPSKGGEFENTEINSKNQNSTKKSNKVTSISPPLEGSGEALKPAEALFPSYRVFVDSAPVLERYWAVKAGLGWIGKNNLLIIPHAGTMFFLGEIFVDIELEYDKPTKNFCGRCTRCIDNCPTHALTTHPFDASLCLSYQLIENRGELSEAAKKAMGDTIYGCDRCQQACPWNRFATPNTDPDLQPSDDLLTMSKEDWQNLDIDKYRKLFKGSAVKRAKYEGLMRNIEAASKEDNA